MKLANLLILLVAPWCAGCAAMFTGTKDDVALSARQPDTWLVLEDERHELPCSLPLSKKTKRLVFWHADHGEVELELDRRFRFGFLLMDVLFTPGYGLSGILIDGATAAWYDLPDTVVVDVEALARRAREGEADEPPPGEGDAPEAPAAPSA